MGGTSGWGSDGDPGRTTGVLLSIQLISKGGTRAKKGLVFVKGAGKGVPGVVALY